MEFIIKSCDSLRTWDQASLTCPLLRFCCQIQVRAQGGHPKKKENSGEAGLGPDGTPASILLYGKPVHGKMKRYRLEFFLNGFQSPIRCKCSYENDDSFRQNRYAGQKKNGKMKVEE